MLIKLVKKVYQSTKFTTTSKQSLHDQSTQLTSTSKQSLHDQSTKFTTTSKQSLHNNINNNINNNIVCCTDNAREEKEVEIETQPIPNDKQKKKKELKAKIDEYKNLIAEATGEGRLNIDLVLKPHVYMKNLDKLLEKIKASKFLLGEKEQKPSLRIFAYKTNEIIAGMYDDFKTKNKASNKLDTQDIEYTVSDAQKQVLEALGL